MSDVTATEQPDLGGNTAASPSAEESIATPSPEAEASAGTENTAQSAEREQYIPRPRFDQVNAKRKEAETALEAERRAKEALQAELEALRNPKEQPKEDDGEVELPPDWHTKSEMQKLRYLIAKVGVEEVEKAAGMKLEDLKIYAGAAKEGGNYAAQQRWREVCDKNGFDPADLEVQENVMGLVKVGKTLEEAISRTAKLYGKPKSNGARVESEVSVTPTLGGNPVEARDARHASELAAKGQKVPFRSSPDIIAAALKVTKETRP